MVGWSNPVIPKPAMVTGLILAVAILAFAGLAFQTVPASVAYTETLTSYSPYSVHTTTTYLSTSSTTTTIAYPATTTCVESMYPAICSSYPPHTVRIIYIITGITVHLGYWTQEIAAVPYSVTASSTSLIPASAAFGLTDGLFGALALIVVGQLALLTAWATLKARTTHKPRQAKLGQFAKEKPEN